MYSLILACLMPVSYGEQATPAVTAPVQTATCTGSSCHGRTHRTHASCTGQKASCTGQKASCTGHKASCHGTAVVQVVKVKEKVVRTRASCTGASCTGAKTEAKPMVAPDKPKQGAAPPIAPPKKASVDAPSNVAVLTPRTETGRIYRRITYFEPYVTDR